MEKPMIPNIHALDAVIRRALEEDVGSGDITTLATVEEGRQIAGRFVAKEDGIICGLPVLKRVFELLDIAVLLEPTLAEGAAVKKGDLIARIEGPARSILTGERVALNFLQRLSGIATRTHEAVRMVAGTRAAITDTRKTTPGLRVLEKYAVRVGGGRNHRFSLCDGVLIKDNHIRAAGGIAEAVARARRAAPHMLKVEVETESFAQIDEALRSGADIIMLDNMSLPDMAEAVRIIAGQALVEASGNMGEADLQAVARTGVDLISIGALTHSVQALDISLRFDENI
jgi:nicotinate-nucleotide pyrophosphorylase (carboxylating)